VRELEHQNAIAYGKVMETSTIEAENRNLKAEIDGLKDRLTH
jgi:hypothetical protein